MSNVSEFVMDAFREGQGHRVDPLTTEAWAVFSDPSHGLKQLKIQLHTCRMIPLSASGLFQYLTGSTL